MILSTKAHSLLAKCQASLTWARGQRAPRLFLFGGALSAFAALSACGGPSAPVGVVGHVQGFAGMVVADEPRAAMVGRDVLSSGGSPADAAAAMALTMAVTYPSDVSLGAGGTCLVFDAKKNSVEALNFIAGPRDGFAYSADRPAAQPALARGLYALHSRYGRLRWEQLMGPADNMARMGFPASRAFVTKLDPMANVLFDDPAMRRIFSRADGGPLQEGDIVTQYSLGGALSRIRSRGVGDFYSGVWARDIAKAFSASGGGLSSAEMDAFTPQWVTPIAVPMGGEVAYFAPLPASAGLVQAQFWALLASNPAYLNADTRNETMIKVFAAGMNDREVWLNADGSSRKTIESLLSSDHLAALGQGRSEAPPPGFRPLAQERDAGTGLVAVDSDGNAVSCAIGLNAPFGTGRIAEGTGIVIGALAGHDGKGPYSMGPMMIVNPNSQEFRFAAAAGGGASTASALISVALESQINERPLRDAVAAKRLFTPASSRTLLVEPGFPNVDSLQTGGRDVRLTPMTSKVNAARCESGSPSLGRCQVATDPRGAGLAIKVGAE